VSGRSTAEGSIRLNPLGSTASAISLQMSHGYRIETDKMDPLINLVETAAKEFYIATYPGRWLVDAMPFCEITPNSSGSKLILQRK
jgi:hypothetical protein